MVLARKLFCLGSEGRSHGLKLPRGSAGVGWLEKKRNEVFDSMVVLFTSKRGQNGSTIFPRKNTTTQTARDRGRLWSRRADTRTLRLCIFLKRSIGLLRNPGTTLWMCDRDNTGKVSSIPEKSVKILRAISETLASNE